MSLEETAKKYSEKWGVSMEEATRRTKAFLEEQPKRRAGRGKALGHLARLLLDELYGDEDEAVEAAFR